MTKTYNTQPIADLMQKQIDRLEKLMKLPIVAEQSPFEPEFRTCGNCEDGEEERQKECFKSASDCCGGCFETVTCRECDGSGIIEI